MALGLVLLVVLVWRIGFGRIWDALSSLNWRLIPLIAAIGVSEFVHVIAWRHCLTEHFRPISLARLFGISMSGYAINYLTPTASLGGDMTKALQLSSRGGMAEAVAAVLINKLSFAIAHMLLVFAGCIWVLEQLTLPRSLLVPLLISAGALGIGIVTFLILQKRGKLGALLRWMAERSAAGPLLQKKEQAINRVDESLRTFYRTRSLDFALSVAWHLVGYAVGILQTWYLLMLTGRPDLLAAVGVWFLGIWFEFLTFAVPLNLGTLEAGSMIAFGAVGRSAATGMAYGIGIRLAQLFWAGFGLAIYLWRPVRDRQPAKDSTTVNGKEFPKGVPPDAEQGEAAMRARRLGM